MKTTIAGLVLVGIIGYTVPGHGQEPSAATLRGPQGAILGAWTLDKDLSDSLDRMTGGGGRGPGGSGGGMGGMGGGGGRGGTGGGMGGGGGRGGQPGGMGGGGGRGGSQGMGGMPDSEDARRTRDVIMGVLAAPGGLTIVNNEGTVTITTSDGVSRKYVSDGKKAELVTGDGVIKYKAKWDGPILAIESEIEKGPKISWTFLPMAGDRDLLVVVRVSGDQMPRATLAHHIYTRTP